MLSLLSEPGDFNSSGFSSHVLTIQISNSCYILSVKSGLGFSDILDSSVGSRSCLPAWLCSVWYNESLWIFLQLNNKTFAINNLLIKDLI